MLRKVIGLHQLTHGVHVDILQILFAVAFTAQHLIALLFFLQAVQQFLEGRYKRQRPTTGLCFSPIFLYGDRFPIQCHLRDSMLDLNGLFPKVNGVPFEASHFASAQPVKGCQDHTQFDGISFDCVEKRFQLLLIINRGVVFPFSRALYPVGRI